MSRPHLVNRAAAGLPRAGQDRLGRAIEVAFDLLFTIGLLALAAALICLIYVALTRFDITPAASGPETRRSVLPYEKQTSIAETTPLATQQPRPENAMTHAPLVNRAAARRFALEYAKTIGRRDVITHIGADVYPALDELVRRRLCLLVEQHPSGFRTLKP